APAEIDSGVDIETITELFLAALGGPYEASGDRTREQMQRIGAVALETNTVAESVRRQVIAQRLPSHDWPQRVLRLTAIDTATGELVVFDRDSGVGLVDAVAASCAGPGAWPPGPIAGPAAPGRPPTSPHSPARGAACSPTTTRWPPSGPIHWIRAAASFRRRRDASKAA